MKKRSKRDITLLFGVLIIIGSITFLTGQMSRQDLIKKYEGIRTELEAQELAKSDMLLEWTHMRETKGKPHSGGKFSEGLMARDGTFANVVGFMVPQEQWIDVTEFLLLPLPLECYFCQMPPPRDVMLVKLAEGHVVERLLENPVIINGKFTVNQGPDQKFFYTLSDATMGAMEGVPMVEKDVKIEHMAPTSEHPGAKEGDGGMLDPTQKPRLNNAPETD